MLVEPLGPQELLEVTAWRLQHDQNYCKIVAFQMARSVTTRS